jgi:glycosyltransferase involved in cell wall biosynthesis
LTETAIEALSASAADDAVRRGLSDITVFLSSPVEAAVLRRLLSDPVIASVGTGERVGDDLPADLSGDPRIGRFWEPGAWSLPEPAEHIYLLESWRRLTPDMLREALRREVSSLRIRVGERWVTVPLRQIQAALPMLHAINRTAASASGTARAALTSGRRGLAGVLSLLGMGSSSLVGRIVGPSAPEGFSLESVFDFMLKNRPAPIDPVPGRVVLVCGSLNPGGAERQVAYTLRGLAREGFESVWLLCHHLRGGSRHRYDFYLPAIAAEGVRAREIRRRPAVGASSPMPPGLEEAGRRLPPGLARDIGNLYREFADLRPQVVHAWLDWDNVRAGLAAVLAGVPRVVLSGRNVSPRHFALYQPYMDPAYRILVRQPAVTLINNSRAGGDDYADWIEIPRDRITVVYNAIDFADRRRSPPQERAAFRASLGIEHDAFVVGGVFRLDEEKRPLSWIRTAALVARSIADARFIIFGGGPMREEIERVAQEEGITGRLNMPGVTNDVLAAISIMDVFLLTSSDEGLPNVILEAQWVGTPVVATNVGGVSEALEIGVTGWTGPPDDIEGLAARITWLHENASAIEAARSRGPSFVREKFGIDRMIADTIGVYGIGRPARAPSSPGQPAAKN